MRECLEWPLIRLVVPLSAWKPRTSVNAHFQLQSDAREPDRLELSIAYRSLILADIDGFIRVVTSFNNVHFI